MHPSISSLPRRTFLRGLGAMLSLPFLDAMTPLSALAAAGKAPGKTPIRMVFVGLEGGIWTGEDGFFPWKTAMDVERTKGWGRNGIMPGGALADVGADFKLTSTLQPLAAHRKDILLLSGLHHPNDKIPNTVVNAHGQDLGTLLTGVNISGTPGVALKNGISIDQYVAGKIGERTRLPSLELAVGTSSYNTKEASSLGYMGFLSYDADGYAMPLEGDPAAVFDRLFTGGTAKEQAQRESQRRQNKSILDAALDDMKRLETKVAAQDRRKLDEYFTTVRELEKRIERAKQWENTPVALPPGAARPKVEKGQPAGDGSDRVERMRLMLDMLALALQTDTTRVASIRLGGYFGSFAFLGFPEDPHGVYAHNGGDPAKFAGARAIDRMHVEQFAYLLSKLKDAKEDGGSVLDNSMVFYGAGLTNGPTGRVAPGGVPHMDAHGQFNAPVMLAGRAGGALKTGRHINFDHGTRLSNLYVTMMNLMGVDETKFADSTEPLTGLV